MTDEQMDARLHRAGAAWRAANPATDVLEPPSEPVDLAAPPRRTRLPRPGLLISAAAVAAALVAGVAVVVANVGGTGQHRSADVAGLEANTWQLVSYGNAQAFPHSTATVAFNKDGTFVADDSCQVFGGSYDVDHGQLFANPHDLRARQCTDSSGEQVFGDRGMQLLTGGPTYTIDGSALTLRADGQTMHLRAAPELPSPTLDVPTAEGATWLLTGVTDSTGQPLPVRGSPTFVIKHNELRASDGCNTLSGEVVLLGNTLSTAKGGGLQTTEVGCQTDASNAATVVDAVLSQDARVSVRGATMTIKNGSGSELTYQWQPDDAQGTSPALLASRSWQLTSIAGDPVTVHASLRVTEAGAVSGNDGCQAFAMQAADVGHGTLQLPVTLKRPAQCHEPAATTIDSFLAQQPVLWRIEDGKLLLFGGGAQAFSLVFAPDRPIRQVSTPPSISGKPWTLTQISSEGSGSGSGTGTSDSGVLLTIRSATFTLETNCHSYSGTVTQNADKILFSDVRDLGGDNCHDQFADAAVSLLQHGAATWSVRGGELELVDGRTTLTFDS